jgi:hypothetical protein
LAKGLRQRKALSAIGLENGAVAETVIGGCSDDQVIEDFDLEQLTGVRRRWVMRR